MATFSNRAIGSIGMRGVSSLQEAGDAILGIVDVSPPGYALPIDWTPVAGATGAEVASASVRVGPALLQQTQQLPVAANGADREVAIPAGQQLLSLTLSGLKWRHPGDDNSTVEDAIASGGDLSGRGLRLIVSIPAATGWTPLLAVPGLGGRGMLPPALQSASFQQGVLSLPGLSAARIRLNIVTGDTPEEFTPQDVALDATVSAQVGIPTTGLKVTGPEGAVLWQFPGGMPSNAPAVDVDLTAALERTLKQAVKAGQPPAATFTVVGASPCSASVNVAGARGALLRDFPGALRASLQGDPFPLPLGGPLAAEQPASAMAALVIKYEGIRILEPVSDSVPPSGGTGGTIVTDQPVTRALPPQALTGFPVARIGLIGRCPVGAPGQPGEPCELSVQLVDMSSGAPGQAIGRPGVVRAAPSAALGTVWVELPAMEAAKAPVGIAARATKGRFFWAGSPSPLVRVAVRDPDPGSRPLRLGGSLVLNVGQTQTKQLAFALPTGVFRNAAPAWDSPLFLTVDLSDLTLRYAR
jgi:hypothetical protein